MDRVKIGRRGLLAFAVAAVISACAAVPAASETPQIILLKTEPLEIVTPSGRTKLTVEVADTPPTRERGLMYRKSLAPDRGMLFDFRKPQPVAFWMRNTLIPLDLVFIRADGTVLSIARNARPLDESPIPSGGPIRGVLELAGGRAAQIGVLPGDRIVHRIFPGK